MRPDEPAARHALKTTLVLIFALGLLALMRRRSAAVRHWVLAASLFGAAALPILQMVVPAWRLPSPLRAREVATVTIAGDLSGVSPIGHIAAAPSATASAAPPLSLATALMTVWLLGVVTFMAALLAGVLRLSRVASRARRVADGGWAQQVDEVRRQQGVRRPVRLLETGHPPLLIAWGVRRPTVVISRDGSRLEHRSHLARAPSRDRAHPPRRLGRPARGRIDAGVALVQPAGLDRMCALAPGKRTGVRRRRDWPRHRGI